MASEDAKAAARELLRSYLGKRFRVEVSDGRVVEGTFVCTDSSRNIVLSNCEEFYDRREIEQMESGAGCAVDRTVRSLGMAIVPGEHILNITMATNTVPMATETSSTTTGTSTGSLPATVDPTQTLDSQT